MFTYFICSCDEFWANIAITTDFCWGCTGLLVEHLYWLILRFLTAIGLLSRHINFAQTTKQGSKLMLHYQSQVQQKTCLGQPVIFPRTPLGQTDTGNSLLTRQEAQSIVSLLMPYCEQQVRADIGGRKASYHQPLAAGTNWCMDVLGDLDRATNIGPCSFL